MDTEPTQPAPNGGCNNLKSEPLTLESFKQVMRSLKGRNFKSRRASARQINYFHTIKNLTSFESLRGKSFQSIPTLSSWVLLSDDSRQKKLLLTASLKDELIRTVAKLMSLSLLIEFTVELKMDSVYAFIHLADNKDNMSPDQCYIRVAGPEALAWLDVEQHETICLKATYSASLADVTRVIQEMWALSVAKNLPVTAETGLENARFYGRYGLKSEVDTDEPTPLALSGDLLLQMDMFAGPWDLRIYCYDADEVAAPNWDRANSVLWDAPIDRLEGTYDDEGDLLTIRSRYDKGLYTLIFSNKHGIGEVPEFLEKTGVKFELEPW